MNAPTMATAAMTMVMRFRLLVISARLGLQRQFSIGIIEAPRCAMAAHYGYFTRNNVGLTLIQLFFHSGMPAASERLIEADHRQQTVKPGLHERIHGLEQRLLRLQ